MGLLTSVYTISAEKRWMVWQWIGRGISAEGPYGCARSGALRPGAYVELHREGRDTRWVIRAAEWAVSGCRCSGCWFESNGRSWPKAEWRLWSRTREAAAHLASRG